jgi:hypothetical protein
VGFRLEARRAGALAERAARHGQSPGQYARALVEHAMDGGQEMASDLSVLREAIASLQQLTEATRAAERFDALADEIAGTQAEVCALREDLATLATAVLTTAGKVPLEDARKWVGENLLR